MSYADVDRENEKQWASFPVTALTRASTPGTTSENIDITEFKSTSLEAQYK
eukprot:COSAG01_NODE_4239_length_5213_cov_3.152914_7_plen_51_part_00